MAHKFESETTTDSTNLIERSYFRSIELKLKTIKQEHKILLRQKNDLQRLLNEQRSEIRKLRKTPLIVGNVEETLDNGVIIKSSTGPSFFVNYSSQIKSSDLLPGTQIALNQKYFSVIDILPKSDDPFIQNMEVDDRPDTSYDQIGGLSYQIREVVEALELSISNPELFEKIGIESPKGVLLFGPPGTGKTLIAKAIAHQTKARFISVIGSELVQKYIGEGARLVRDLFQYAQKQTPCIIFIDEIDAIGSKRMDSGTSGDREVQRTFMQLLSEMDGFSENDNVKIIGATNRPDILDPALLRSGRFDRHVEIPLPDYKGRLEIFKIHTAKMNLRKEVIFEVLADRSDGFSGADIRSICIEAGLNAIRTRRVRIKHEDFLLAFDTLKKATDNDILKKEPALYS